MQENEASAFDGAPIARAIQQRRTPGTSLDILTSIPSFDAPAWARNTPIGVGYASFHRTAMDIGDLLSADACRVVADSIARYRTLGLPGDEAWQTESLTALRGDDRRGAALAILAGLAPQRITDAAVADWRAGIHADQALIRLLAYGAAIAVGLIETDITAAVV